MNADEAHKPHATDICSWLIAVQCDLISALHMMPAGMQRLLHDMELIDNSGITAAGETFLIEN